MNEEQLELVERLRREERSKSRPWASPREAGWMSSIMPQEGKLFNGLE